MFGLVQVAVALAGAFGSGKVAAGAGECANPGVGTFAIAGACACSGGCDDGDDGDSDDDGDDGGTVYGDDNALVCARGTNCSVCWHSMMMRMLPVKMRSVSPRLTRHMSYSPNS